jgi:hypothetical protein
MIPAHGPLSRHHPRTIEDWPPGVHELLFGRRAPTIEPAAEPTYRPAPLRVLRADGQRIDLSKRDAGQLLVATRQAWASQAWQYRDLIGELRYAIRLLSRSVARVRFYPAQVQPWPDDPVPLDGDEHELDKQLAADAVHNFGLLPIDSNPDGFTARLVENLSVAGEAWVHIDAEDRFWVRSTSEITANSDGRVMLSTLPTATLGSQRQIDAETEDLLRTWVPHPEWGQLADSPMRCLLDVAEDVVLAGREQRAAARSRVAANGILLMPSSLSLVRARTEDDDRDDSVSSDTFMADFTSAMLAPIRDDGDAQVVVPIVIRGEIDDLKEVRHVTLQRADANALIERQSSALLRLLRGLDVQPEQVEGVGGANHWSGWLVEAQSVKHQVQPTAETVAACLSQAFLRPALRSLDHDPAEVGQVTIGVDVSPLSENPNRGQDARDAHAALVISDEALRSALGFSDDDKPDDEEVARRIAAKQGLPPEVAAGVLELSRYMQQARGSREVIELPSRPAELPSSERPAAQPGQLHPDQTTPADPDVGRGPPGPVVAAATPDDGWIVDVDTARRLADIDTALAERITVAADAAIARMLERAGARVRTAARNDRALAASVAGVEPHLIPTRLGRLQVEAFVPIADLLADSYARLRGQVTQWLAEAARQVGDVVVTLLRLDPLRQQRVRGTVTARLAARSEQAWTQLTEVLDTAAQRALFAPDPFNPDADLPGEGAGALIRPGEVNRVLSTAGGGGGGLGTGTVVQGLMGEQGAVLLGWEWQYRPELLRNTFLPHMLLDGTRFATFTDPKLDTDPATSWLGSYFRPGDHDGCRCKAVPVVAVPELEDGIVAQRLREAAGDPRNIRASEIAAQDAAAGRVGTSLQNEVEVRTRITTVVQRLQREYIDQGGRVR